MNGGGQFRRGVRLGIDWGAARVGVAACDPEGLLAYPVETIPARDRDKALVRIAELAGERDPLEIVMGWPIALSGREELAAESVKGIAVRLAALVSMPVRLMDERMTTAQVNNQLGNLDTRKRRIIVDRAAATGILESALSYERHTGTPPGQLVDHPWTKGEA